MENQWLSGNLQTGIGQHMLTREDLAGGLGVHPASIRVLIRERGFPYHIATARRAEGGRPVHLWSPDDVLAWLSVNGSAGTGRRLKRRSKVALPAGNPEADRVEWISPGQEDRQRRRRAAQGDDLHLAALASAHGRAEAPT